jgi:hypothetical protein
MQSSNPLVVPSPASVTIPPGETGAAFTLQVGNGTGTTLLSTNTANGMVIPIVLNGQTPKLDTVITGPYYISSVSYGDDVVISAAVAARLPDGTYPTGVLELLDESNAVLAQQNLGPTGGVTFTRSGLQPGSYVYRLRYSGDAHFNALGPVTLPTVTVYGWYTSVTVTIPKVICGNTVDVMAIVSTSATTQPPTGQVRISFGNQVLLLDLVPTSAPGKSRATAQLALPSYSYYVDVSYLPTGTFASSSNYNYLPTVGGCAPVGLNATATALNRVALSWSPTGASSYEIFRTTQYYGVSSIGYATTNSYIDTQVEANRTYIYRVRPAGGAMSEPEIATTAFTRPAPQYRPFPGYLSAPPTSTTCAPPSKRPAVTSASCQRRTPIRRCPPARRSKPRTFNSFAMR